MDADLRVLAARMEAIVDGLTKRVDERFDDVIERGDQRHFENQGWLRRHDEKLASIEVQTIKTNGRLTNAEHDIAGLKAAVRNAVKGITLKDVSIWIAIIGGSFYVLTQILGFTRP